MLCRVGLKATGTLYKIGETQQISARFQKREFVVEIADNPQYPQLVQFQLTGNRVGAIDDYRVGDQVDLEFSLRGREWTSPKGDVKYFNSLDVWTIERAGQGMAPPEEEPPIDDGPLPQEPPDITDDIPF